MLSDGTRTIEKSQSGPCRGHGSASYPSSQLNTSVISKG
jgi:hypothetical protein